MPLLPAYYTTTNQRKRKAKKPSKSSQEHEVWLKSQGLHSSQIKGTKTTDPKWKQKYSDSLKVDRSTANCDSSGMKGSASSCANRSIMANLHKEPEHVREAILEKAKRVMPLYNKGGLQLLSESDDLKALNKTVRT